MTVTRSGDRERDADPKARRRAQARHDRAVRRGQGRCQACGVTCAPGSRSRCLVCLERARRARRRREGKPTVRPKGRGRRLLGSWGIGSGRMSGMSMATENRTFVATEHCTLLGRTSRAERTFSR